MSGPARTAPVLAALAMAALLSAVAAVFIGPMRMGPAETVRALIQGLGLAEMGVDPLRASVAADLRLGRVVLGLLVGAGLGVAGTVYQGVLRNPLADPFTLGVSSGAAFGASLAITLGLAAGTSLPATILPLAALTGAATALALVLALSRLGGGMRRETLVLAGIVTATFLQALVSLVKSLNEESVASIVFWIMGSLQGRGWLHAGLYAPYFLVGALITARHFRELDILSLGETQARSLGVEAGRTRLWLVTGASVAAGAAVAVSGVVGFVGLMVPHLARMILGPAHGPLLAASALGGGMLVVWSDVLARSILPGGAELPVGVVTALLGGPFFCLLLARRRT